MTQLPAPTIGPATPVEHEAITELLTRSGLSALGLEEHWDAALVARLDGAIVACAALELYPDGGLLRSVAVEEGVRGLGLGVRITEAALDDARRRGVDQVYLLTETAEAFFPRFGFRRTRRGDVPASVRQSVEFTSLCPDSAAVMVLAIGEGV